METKIANLEFIEIKHNKPAHLLDYKKVRLVSLVRNYDATPDVIFLPIALIEWLEEKQHKIYVNKLLDPVTMSYLQTYFLLLTPDDHLEYLLRWGVRH